jgi:hypothetical protein
MNNRLDSQTKLHTTILVMIFFAGSVALADYVIRFYVSVLQVSASHPVVAGVTEPLTTKLVPALAVVYFHQNDRYKLDLAYLQSHPYWFSVLGGLSLGVFERMMYLVVKDAAITPGFILAPAMHILNTVLIAGFIFTTVGRYREYRVLGQLFVFIIAAIVIHVFWNTWGVILVHQAFQ